MTTIVLLNKYQDVAKGGEGGRGGGERGGGGVAVFPGKRDALASI